MGSPGPFQVMLLNKLKHMTGDTQDIGDDADADGADDSKPTPKP